MPSSTVEKLFQLRSQLQQCTNPTAAKVLKSAIKKLEAQLDPSQPKTTASKVAQRKAAHKKSERKSRQKASQKQRTTLKPPSLNKIEPKPEVISQSKKLPNPAQEKLHVKTVDTPNSKNSNSKNQNKLRQHQSQNQVNFPRNLHCSLEMALIGLGVVFPELFEYKRRSLKTGEQSRCILWKLMDNPSNSSYRRRALRKSSQF